MKHSEHTHHAECLWTVAAHDIVGGSSPLCEVLSKMDVTAQQPGRAKYHYITCGQKVDAAVYNCCDAARRSRIKTGLEAISLFGMVCLSAKFFRRSYNAVGNDYCNTAFESCTSAGNEVAPSIVNICR